MGPRSSSTIVGRGGRRLTAWPMTETPAIVRLETTQPLPRHSNYQTCQLSDVSKSSRTCSATATSTAHSPVPRTSRPLELAQTLKSRLPDCPARRAPVFPAPAEASAFRLTHRLSALAGSGKPKGRRGQSGTSTLLSNKAAAKPKVRSGPLRILGCLALCTAAADRARSYLSEVPGYRISRGVRKN